MHEFPKWDLFGVKGFELDISAILALLVSSIIVFVICRLAVRNLSVTNPSKMQNFLEWVVDFVRGLVASTQDLKKGKVYVSLATTLIMFIFVSNLLGLPFLVTTEHHHPLQWAGHDVISQSVIDKAIEKGDEEVSVSWWKSPTADISVTAALALMVFIIIHVEGIRRNTKHYFAHFFKPYWFFFPLNLLETLAKPLTLALRLFANIFAGEVLISTILMAGWAGLPLMAAWQGFSIFVGAIQAFLFTILTMVYIAQTTVHEEGH
ncbi:F0F1 ATP synthase subunit A [Gorillibacterium massiliense]|uniref:F0F1 ATP synthase subunit A n=1 Tax=Gorillibacterium massiliense TaxID=1280390 RepID=UPI0004B56BE4|nr:F0F1 ATP synthase subunit A [Gorillibacterium massiliense]